MKSIIATTAAGLLLLLTSPALADTLERHCDGANDNAQSMPDGYTIDVDNDSFDPRNVDGPNLTLPDGTLFCVKAGPSAAGILTFDGEYTVTWTVGDGSTPDISYYMTYTKVVPPVVEPPVVEPPVVEPPVVVPPVVAPPVVVPPIPTSIPAGEGPRPTAQIWMMIASLLAALAGWKLSSATGGRR